MEAAFCQYIDKDADSGANAGMVIIYSYSGLLLPARLEQYLASGNPESTNFFLGHGRYTKSGARKEGTYAISKSDK